MSSLIHSSPTRMRRSRRESSIALFTRMRFSHGPNGRSGRTARGRRRRGRTLPARGRPRACDCRWRGRPTATGAASSARTAGRGPRPSRRRPARGAQDSSNSRARYGMRVIAYPVLSYTDQYDTPRYDERTEEPVPLRRARVRRGVHRPRARARASSRPTSATARTSSSSHRGATASRRSCWRARPGAVRRQGVLTRAGRPDDDADEGEARREAREGDPRGRSPRRVYRAREQALRVFRGLRITPTVTIDPEDTGGLASASSAGRAPADLDATLERLLDASGRARRGARSGRSRSCSTSSRRSSRSTPTSRS